MLMLTILFLAGAGMLFVGARGIIARRATIYSGKWLFALVALCFFPQFTTGLKLLAASPSAAMISILMYPLLLVVFWLATKGFICFGVSEETANDALKNAFEKLGLKHEQFLASIRLEDGGIFQVSMQDWMGTMQIKPKNPEARARTAALAAALAGHFSASAAKVRYLPYWIYALGGTMLLALLLVLLGLLASLPKKDPVRQEQAKTARAAVPGFPLHRSFLIS